MEGVSKKIGIDKIDLVRILEFLPYPFLVSELRADTQHNIFVNSRFLEEIGYSIDELPTIKDWFEAAYPDVSYREKIILQWSDLALKAKRERQDSFEMPALIHTRAHGDVWYEVKASVHGPVQFVAFVNIDANMKRELELKRLNDNKDHMLSILSHDLRSPLASLYSVLQMITSGQMSDAEKEAVLLTLTRQVFQLTEFLETTLNWTRTNFSKTVVRNTELDFGLIISDIVKLYELSLAAKNITLTIGLRSELKRSGDPEVYSIIVRNIVSNAVKYTPPNGTIKISDGVENNRYVVMIENSGQKISEEKITEILSGNVKSNPGTDGEKGLGLGLKLTQQLLHTAGGKLEISSNDKVTTFKVLFPSNN